MPFTILCFALMGNAKSTTLFPTHYNLQNEGRISVFFNNESNGQFMVDPLFNNPISERDTFGGSGLFAANYSENKSLHRSDFDMLRPLAVQRIGFESCFSQGQEPGFVKDRRKLYSSLWTFASLNYLYADLVGLMDANKLVQYQAGVVDGLKITPGFLTVAAGFMQVPIANVFLPHLIKNDRTLRWVQIASGSVMTLVQAGTLLVGKPTPYYALFSVFEIAATACVTIDAIRWKTLKNKRGRVD